MTTATVASLCSRCLPTSCARRGATASSRSPRGVTPSVVSGTKLMADECLNEETGLLTYGRCCRE